MLTMCLPRFHSEIDTVVKPNIAGFRKPQNIDFEPLFVRSRLSNGNREHVLGRLEAGQSVTEVVHIFGCNRQTIYSEDTYRAKWVSGRSRKVRGTWCDVTIRGLTNPVKPPV